jgi:uncharacterized membrane protein YbhN (UPF0104 family)
VIVVGLGADDVAVLATAGDGHDIPTGSLDESALIEMWTLTSALHDAGIAHGSLGRAAFGAAAESIVIRDLAAASLNAADVRMSLDVVSLLVETAAEVGSEVAVRAALSGLGESRVLAALPFLQPPALTRDQRKLVAKPKAFINELRSGVADATGADLPEPGKLRRVEPKALVMPALSLVAAYVLIGMLANIDYAAVWSVVQDATWAWIVIGFIVGHLVFLPEATGMVFASGYELPLRPLVILQVSVKWIGLAVPSAAGRVTMNTLFLRKFGVPPTIALTQGALDGIAGFAVEVGVLLLAVVATDISFSLSTEEINWTLVLAVVLALIGVSVVAVLRIARLRAIVLPVLRDAWNLLWDVIKDPKRALGLLGSNLAARAILATTLWFILQAIGVPLPFFAALVVTVATNLLGGLVPIPGGIGVAEAVMTSMLIMFGVPPEAAFAAAIVFRASTFYIPAAEGFFAMRWLESNGYL